MRGHAWCRLTEDVVSPGPWAMIGSAEASDGQFFLSCIPFHLNIEHFRSVRGLSFSITGKVSSITSTIVRDSANSGRPSGPRPIWSIRA